MLCCSFVVSTGYVKDCGLLVMSWGVTEHWMPAVVGACFFPLFVLACFCLHQTPAPTEKDRVWIDAHLPFAFLCSGENPIMSASPGEGGGGGGGITCM